MSTSIQIWNQAMLKIGADRITAAAGLDADAQLEAQLAETIYATEKKAILRSYPWNCATKRALLPLSANKPVNQFNFAYALPIDNLRVLEARNGNETLLNANGDGVRAYVVEGKFVLTNEQGIVLKYISNIDEALFDVHLEEALVAKLSFESVYALGQSNTAMSNFGQVYEGKLSEARITDALENPHVVSRTASLDRVRW
jgi:hypothetical protein